MAQLPNISQQDSLGHKYDLQYEFQPIYPQSIGQQSVCCRLS